MSAGSGKTLISVGINACKDILNLDMVGEASTQGVLGTQGTGQGEQLSSAFSCTPRY